MKYYLKDRSRKDVEEGGGCITKQVSRTLEKLKSEIVSYKNHKVRHSMKNDSKLKM